MERFPMNARTIEEAKHYSRNRCTQFLAYGFYPTRYEIIDECVVTYLRYKNDLYDSGQMIYVLEQNRGKGLYMKVYEKTEKLVTITLEDCGILSFLTHNNIPYKSMCTSYEYELVQEFYGNKKANRSDQYLMNHIDEGLAVIKYFSAESGEIKVKAEGVYTLHPLLQGDKELKDNYKLMVKECGLVEYLLGAMEYRNIANQYLSQREIESLDEISLSPLDFVNLAIAADKIQNYKDFILYHKETHPRSKELDLYFNNWLRKFNVPQKLFDGIFEILDAPRHVFSGKK